MRNDGNCTEFNKICWNRNTTPWITACCRACITQRYHGRGLRMAIQGDANIGNSPAIYAYSKVKRTFVITLVPHSFCVPAVQRCFAIFRISSSIIIFITFFRRLLCGNAYSRFIQHIIYYLCLLRWHFVTTFVDRTPA